MGRKTIFNQAWNFPGVAGKIACSVRLNKPSPSLSLMGKALNLNSMDPDQANRYYQLEIEPALNAQADEVVRNAIRTLCQNTLEDLQTLKQAELSAACTFYAANPDLMLLLGDPNGYRLVHYFCQLHQVQSETIRTVHKAYFTRFLTSNYPLDLDVSVQQAFKAALHQHQHHLNPLLIKTALRLPQLLQQEPRLPLFMALYPKIKSTVPSLREVQMARKHHYRPVSILRSPSFAMAVFYGLSLAAAIRLYGH